jgi:hypothetical protein
MLFEIEKILLRVKLGSTFLFLIKNRRRQSTATVLS